MKYSTRLEKIIVQLTASAYSAIEIGIFTRTYNDSPNSSNMCRLPNDNSGTWQSNGGTRDCKFTGNYAGRNTSNTIVVLPFTTGMDFSANTNNGVGWGSGNDPIGFALTIENIGGGSFRFKVEALFETAIKFIHVTYLVYEKVDVENRNARTFTGAILQANSVGMVPTDELNVMAVNTSNFLLGLSAFEIPQGDRL